MRMQNDLLRWLLVWKSCTKHNLLLQPAPLCKWFVSRITVDHSKSLRYVFVHYFDCIISTWPKLEERHVFAHETNGSLPRTSILLISRDYSAELPWIFQAQLGTYVIKILLIRERGESVRETKLNVRRVAHKIVSIHENAVNQSPYDD